MNDVREPAYLEQSRAQADALEVCSRCGGPVDNLDLDEVRELLEELDICDEALRSPAAWRELLRQYVQRKTQEPHSVLGTCRECGAALEHHHGPEAGGILCPYCDSDFLEFIRERNAPSPTWGPQEAVRQERSTAETVELRERAEERGQR